MSYDFFFVVNLPNLLETLCLGTSYSNCQVRLLPLPVQVTLNKGAFVSSPFLISSGKITIAVASHKKDIFPAADRWCPGCRV